MHRPAAGHALRKAGRRARFAVARVSCAHPTTQRSLYTTIPVVGLAELAHYNKPDARCSFTSAIRRLACAETYCVCACVSARSASDSSSDVPTPARYRILVTRKFSSADVWADLAAARLA